MSTVRQSRKQATRAALREAARSCLSARGWQGTTVGSISARAGVAHGTFYVHYPSKEALMDELLGEFNAELAARLAPVWASAGSSLEARVRRTAELFLDHWRGRRAFVRAYAERLGEGVDVAALRDGINPPAEALVRGQLERLLAQARAPRARAALAAQGLLAMWLRVGLQALFNPAVSRRDAVHVLTRLTLGAVQALVTRVRS